MSSKVGDSLPTLLSYESLIADQNVYTYVEVVINEIL